TLGAVFGLTTCLSAQVREEPESPLDYFIGGCATGAVVGARANGTDGQGTCTVCPGPLCAREMVSIVCFFPAHSYMTGTVACLGLGATAALMKIGNKEGWRLTGPPKL
ncbi:UNVERIFIED_CONTAM: hypothetical protein H355_005291, partial [Colinus virginianus]